MAKKLLVGNYRFDASEKVVFCSGNIAAERFLVVTNITRNTIIYNFADVNTGYGGVTYDAITDETELALLYDTTSMADTDVLQIFIQGDYQEITPAEDILDPVGKLRVSNPENLIDTDFEYGLQSTKWETLQTVNNIPTIYSSSGDTPIDGLVSIDAINGSRNIKVTTNIAHGLSIGDPISVQGVNEYQAEGYFIVTNVPSTTVFYFELDVAATQTGDISGSYTTIIPGKFFEGSTLPVSTADGATTNGADPSTISVTTENTHGFSQDTKIYLRNTVGPRTLKIKDSTATAPDGRPFVDTVVNFSTNTGIALTTDTGRGSFKKNPVVTYDWESTYTAYLSSSDINTTTDRITWNNHGLRDKYALLFQTPYQGLTDGGMVDGTVYYVNVIDTNTIELYDDTSLNSKVNLSALSNSYGLARLSLCYKVESASGTSRRTTFGDYYISQSSPVTSNGVGSPNTSSTSYQINLTSLGLGNPTSLTIDQILLSGDVNSSTEFVTFTIAGTTEEVYSPGNQSTNYVRATNRQGGVTVFENFDASAALTNSGGNTFLNVTASCAGSVGSFVWGSDRYRFQIQVQPTGGTFTDTQKERSGGDLCDADWGLGGTKPGSIVAFQGRTPGSGTLNNDQGVTGVCSSSGRLSGETSFRALLNSSRRITTTSGSATVSTISNSLLGAASLASDTSPDSGGNDDGYWQFSIPWNVSYNGTNYSTVYVGTNSYITFGSGYRIYSGLSVSNPGVNKIMISATDNSCQRVYYGLEGSSPNRTYRIRWEGTNSTSGSTGNPRMVWEAVFYENNTSQIDIHVGRNDRVTSGGDADGFSYLSNQRDYGRYGTFGVRNPTYSVQGTSAGRTGSFAINYTDNADSYGSNSEIYYVFCNSLIADRNTIFIEDHGIVGNQDVTVTVDSTRYTAGDRFGYTNTTSGTTDMPSSFQATATPVNDDVIRLSTTQAPNTDDITRIPTDFNISYVTANDKYNSLYIANHKITGDVTATYTNVTGDPITPLTNGQSVDLTRLNDSRLQLANTGSTNSGSSTHVIEQNNNNVYTAFIDIETSLGFTPGTAEITGLEFRGDFSSSSEYVTLEILDSGGTTQDTYIIGQFDDSGDTATYTTSTTFPGNSNYDISSILHDNGGSNLGFTVKVTPQSSVNYGPGGGPWWGFRFAVSGEDTGLVLTGAGTSSHSFDVASVVGAYDGIFDVKTIPTSNSFTMDGSFKIPIREYEFTSSGINASAGTITFSADHNLLTGEKVTYDRNGNTTILPSGVSDTFAIVISSTVIKLATSALDALNNTAITITSQSGTHKITSSNVIKNIQGPGTVTLVQNSKDVTASGTSFLTQFKRFDKIYIDNGSFVEAYTVDTVSTNTNMTLFEKASANSSSADYYYATQLALRPDGYNLHKPFDGGVDITAGTSPTSRIARQTRKYFRYQSGKGLQTSFAINFNPPKLVKNLIRASGTSATVDTQEQHNLKVNDRIVIAGATVSSGTNTYNGTFTVISVPSPFQFTYTMSEAPTDVRAGGFPTYVRESWTDSFIRGGMFDDQNGFFYEYDGQDLYAVRRSSTKQIAGDINVTRGSQIVTGEGTSFTTQITLGDMIVIRGQSYKVTEISSDIRCVVQPAYRGLNATRVKATKTVDTRTPQSQWNIDKADGTGFTGYNLDTTKIQMAYMDYSWYGAGKIRYGFKDNIGHIRYFHEYVHNNKLDESYFRSGNLPARYEIENGPNSSTSPTLFHFGTSIIMDGTFDDDKAYQFTGQSRPFGFTSGGNQSISSGGASTFSQVTLDGQRVYVYAIPVSQSDAEAVTVGQTFVETTPNELPTTAYITQIDVNGANSLIYLNYPATTANPSGGTEYGAISSGTAFTAGESSAIELQRPVPLISVRLAPSVDSGLTGALGERDIINRMQLRLAQASVTTNKDIELFLIQNTLPSRISFENAQSPSLSQVIRHVAGDTLLAGTTIYNAKVAAGSVSVSLTDLLEIGNSILGGDGIFPAGPDLLTLAVQIQDATGVDFSSPFKVSGNISWSESQA